MSHSGRAKPPPGGGGGGGGGGTGHSVVLTVTVRFIEHVRVGQHAWSLLN